jgi:hypothetical protein
MSLYPNATAAVMLKVGCTFFQKMVYNYKITRQLWREENMARVIDAIKDKEKGWLKTTTTFNVIQATLRRRCQGRNIHYKVATTNTASI